MISYEEWRPLVMAELENIYGRLGEIIGEDDFIRLSPARTDWAQFGDINPKVAAAMLCQAAAMKELAEKLTSVENVLRRSGR